MQTIRPESLQYVSIAACGSHGGQGNGGHRKIFMCLSEIQMGLLA
jgi:hypothetical protein